MTEALVEKQTDIELVLNGGKPEMNSPTVPVTWVFSEETIAEMPTYLLFVEQHNESETYGFDMPHPFEGRRYVCRVDRGVQFLPVFRPGRHRLAVLAFGPGSKDCVNKYLEPSKKSDSRYTRDILWEYVQNSSGWHGAVAGTIVEFEVPEALFEPKPKTGFGALMWRWVNWLHTGEPRDKCQYRKRALISVPKLLAGIIFCAIFAALSGLMLLWSVVGPAAAFLLGFRPRNPITLWRELRKSESQEPNNAIYEYSTYRLWTQGSDQRTSVYLPVTPIELILIFGSPVFVWYAISYAREVSGWLLPVVTAGIATVLCMSLVALVLIGFRMLQGTTAAWYVRWQSFRRREHVRRALERDQREMEMSQRRNQEWQRYLAQNFSQEHKPAAVDLSRIPPAQEGRIVQQFYVGWWTLKAKLCRPYVK